MTPSEIGQAYDQITSLWQRDTFDRTNGIAQLKRAISFTDSRGSALDVGCGCTGRFIDLLLSEGFTPEGVDVSSKMLTLAKERHPDIQFHHEDICDWNPAYKYDLISAWDSIWHVPLTEQEKLIEKLICSLNPNGVLLFSFGGLDLPGEHRDNFMGPDVYYSSLGVNGFLEIVIRAGATCRHLEYDQYPEMHTYLIAQKL